MADTYATVGGFVQFDVNQREVNGKQVRDLLVRALGSQKQVRVTVWPEHGDVDIAKGDFIVAEGKFSQNMGQAADGSPREYLNLSASTLIRFPAATKREREVVQGSSSASTAPVTDDIPF